jgi:hypothetical protein
MSSKTEMVKGLASNLEVSCEALGLTSPLSDEEGTGRVGSKEELIEALSSIVETSSEVLGFPSPLDESEDEEE